MTPRRFVILDRDGTIIVKHPYLAEAELVKLIPGTGEALRALRKMELGLVLITNQSAIGRGLLTLDGLAQIHARMNELLLAEGIKLDGIYFCPHTPEENCACRKPQPGLLLQAAGELGFGYKSCIIIGDNKCDIELAKRVGVPAILVRTGEGNLVAQEAARDPSLMPDAIVEDIGEAARIVQRLWNNGNGGQA